MNAGTSSGRRVVVTGGASGIGAATARRLAADGAAVAIIDRRPEAAGAAAAFQADVSDANAVAEAVEAAARRLGGIDALITAAGITSRGTIEETGPEDFDNVFAVNVRGTYLCARQAMPHLRDGRDPAIVTVGSQLGLVANADNAAYCASKGAVIQLTRAMAIDALPYGIRVNCICPGATDTPLTAAHYSATADRDDQQRQLLGRLIEPAEIAEAIAYLAGPTARATVGAILVVDGGYTIH